MTRKAPSKSTPRHAVFLDRDDPFLSARIASRTRAGHPYEFDYSQTRRTPALLGDRFTYTTLNTKGAARRG